MAKRSPRYRKRFPRYQGSIDIIKMQIQAYRSIFCPKKTTSCFSDVLPVRDLTSKMTHGSLTIRNMTKTCIILHMKLITTQIRTFCSIICPRKTTTEVVFFRLFKSDSNLTPDLRYNVQLRCMTMGLVIQASESIMAIFVPF